MRFAPLALALVLTTACVADVGKGKVKADVQDVPAETTNKTDTSAATAHAVDVSQSSIKALGAKITATHPVDFKTFEGSVKVAGDTLVGVSFSADIASLESDHPKLTEHLKDKDFLDAGTYPKATFESVSVEEGSKESGDWTHTVSGDMTIRGQTKRISFPAKVEVGADKVAASTEFVLNRQDFGVTYPGKPDDLVQDNVRMNIEFVAPRG